MAELVGLAASIVQLGGAGAQLSIKLYNFAKSATKADHDIIDLVEDLDSAGSALNHIGKTLQLEGIQARANEQAINDAASIKRRCELVFAEVQEIISKRKKVGKNGKETLTFAGKMSWPLKEQRVELLRRRLDSLKLSLSLLLDVLKFAQAEAQGKLRTELEKERQTIRALYMQREVAFHREKALEERFKEVQLELAAALQASSTPSRVESDGVVLYSAGSHNAKTHPQIKANIAAMDVLSGRSAGVSDGDTTTTDDEGDNLTFEELAKCTTHVQELLQRITDLQQGLKAGQIVKHHRRRRLHKSYLRFHRRFEAHLVNRAKPSSKPPTRALLSPPTARRTVRTPSTECTVPLNSMQSGGVQRVHGHTQGKRADRHSNDRSQPRNYHRPTVSTDSDEPESISLGRTSPQGYPIDMDVMSSTHTLQPTVASNTDRLPSLSPARRLRRPTMEHNRRPSSSWDSTSRRSTRDSAVGSRPSQPGALVREDRPSPFVQQEYQNWSPQTANRRPSYSSKSHTTRQLNNLEADYRTGDSSRTDEPNRRPRQSRRSSMLHPDDSASRVPLMNPFETSSSPSNPGRQMSGGVHESGPPPSRPPYGSSLYNPQIPSALDAPVPRAYYQSRVQPASLQPTSQQQRPLLSARGPTPSGPIKYEDEFSDSTSESELDTTSEEREDETKSLRRSGPRNAFLSAQSASRPPLVPSIKSQSAYDTPQARIIVEVPRSSRREPLSAHDRAFKERRRARPQEYDEPRRTQRSSIIHDNHVGHDYKRERYDDEDEEEPEPVARRPLRRRDRDAESRRRSYRSVEVSKTDAAEDYINARRGERETIADNSYAFIKAKSSRVNNGPSEAESCRSGDGDRNNEIRLRIGNDMPTTLNLNGDMEGRTLQVVPIENGMNELVITSSTRGESTYRSERGSIRGERRASMLASQSRRDVEEMTERSPRSSRRRREIRSEHDESRRALQRRQRRSREREEYRGSTPEKPQLPPGDRPVKIERSPVSEDSAPTLADDSIKDLPRADVVGEETVGATGDEIQILPSDPDTSEHSVVPGSAPVITPSVSVPTEVTGRDTSPDSVSTAQDRQTLLIPQNTEEAKLTSDVVHKETSSMATTDAQGASDEDDASSQIVTSHRQVLKGSFRSLIISEMRDNRRHSNLPSMRHAERIAEPSLETTSELTAKSTTENTDARDLSEQRTLSASSSLKELTPSASIHSDSSSTASRKGQQKREGPSTDYPSHTLDSDASTEEEETRFASKKRKVGVEEFQTHTEHLPAGELFAKNWIDMTDDLPLATDEAGERDIVDVLLEQWTVPVEAASSDKLHGESRRRRRRLPSAAEEPRRVIQRARRREEAEYRR